MLARTAVLVGGVLALPTPAAAQLGLVEGLFRNVTDLGVYGGVGGLLPARDGLATGHWGLYTFGLELLFAVGPAAADSAPPPTWEVEVAVGYSQLAGLALDRPGLELVGALRELPSVSLYAAHTASGRYVGLRSGLLQTNALQVFTDEGDVIPGSAQSFQIGAVAGQFLDLGRVFPFVEAGWMLRHFPGIEWKTTSLPAGVPRRLTLSGWQVLTGVQVAVK